MARFFSRFAWFVGILAAIVGPAAAASPPVTVGSLVVAEQAGATQLVLELSEHARYQVFLLNEPMRLVVELPPANWRLRGTQAHATGLVAGYRFGQFDATTSRLVVDLAAPARVRRSGYDLPIGKKTHRLVLSLERVSAETFAAEVQPWMSSGSMLKGPAPAAPSSIAALVEAIAPPAAVAGAPARAADAPVAAPTAPVPPTAPRATVTAAAAPAAAAIRPPRRADHKKIVVIDAGHGGVDPGTIGASGTYEKDVTLAMAREIKRQLEATGRYRAVMTRDDDTFVRLRDRVAKARAAEADLFLSVHADSIASAQTRGASIYTLSETASDAEAAALAARENRSDIIAGIDLSTENKEVVSILIDLAQRESMNLSAAFAASLVEELGRQAQLLPNNPHRFAGFAVLKAPDIPSALVELGYLSNRHDETLLTQPKHRSKIGAAIVKAIDDYFTRKVRS